MSFYTHSESTSAASNLQSLQSNQKQLKISVAFNRAGSLVLLGADDEEFSIPNELFPEIFRKISGNKLYEKANSIKEFLALLSEEIGKTINDPELIRKLKLLPEEERLYPENLDNTIADLIRFASIFNCFSDKDRRLLISPRTPKKSSHEIKPEETEYSLALLRRLFASGWMGEVFAGLLTYGFPGIIHDDILRTQRDILDQFSEENGLHPIYASNEDYTTFYEKICNGLFWEVIHNFKGFETSMFIDPEAETKTLKDSVIPTPNEWRVLQDRMKVIAHAWIHNNSTEMAEERLPHPVFWIHDYHHFLLASTIRSQIKEIARQLLDDETLSLSRSRELVAENFKRIPGIRTILNTFHQLPISAASKSHFLKNIEEALNDSFSLAFFLHTPFPTLDSWEIFYRSAPEYAKEVLLGLLSNNIISFHCNAYRNNFIDAVSFTFPESANDCNVQFDEKGYKVLTFDGKRIVLDVKPLGIKLDHHSRPAYDQSMLDMILRLKGNNPNRKILLSMSRLDPPKGILQFLRGTIATLEDQVKALESHDTSDLESILKDLGSFSVILQVIPSRENIQAYKDVKIEFEEKLIPIIKALQERILSQLKSLHNDETNKEARMLLENKLQELEGWQAILYIDKGLPQNAYHTLQMFCDAVFVATLTDGLNLVGAETVMSQAGKLLALANLSEEEKKKLGTTISPATLVTSQLTGLSGILKDHGAVVLKDPTNIEEIKAAILHVFQTPPDERTYHFKLMKSQIIKHLDLSAWSEESRQVFCHWRDIISSTTQASTTNSSEKSFRI